MNVQWWREEVSDDVAPDLRVRVREELEMAATPGQLRALLVLAVVFGILLWRFA